MLEKRIVALLLFLSSLEGVDFGTQGKHFKVSENNLIQDLEKQFSKDNKGLDDALASLGKGWVDSLGRMIPPVSGMKKAVSDREWIYTPLHVLQEDVKDEKGNILVLKGSAFSPLKERQIDGALIFFDARDKDQLEWASTHQECRWVLVGGDPLKLAEELDRMVFFDQGGEICRVLGIKNVPAHVFQEGEVLNIKEIALEKSRV